MVSGLSLIWGEGISRQERRCRLWRSGANEQFRAPQIPAGAYNMA
jgi:hypothetical protein